MTRPDADRRPWAAGLRRLLFAVDIPAREPSAAALRRRRIVTAVATIVGAAALGWSLNVEPGTTTFYVASLVLAAVWGVGAWASGPLHLGGMGPTSAGERPVLPAVIVGGVLAGVFLVGALLVREIAVLEDAVNGVLAYAREGASLLVVGVTVANAITEELFFRGALFAAVPARTAVGVTTAVYALAAAMSGNAMLAFAATVLGLVTALERRSTGGVLAPMLTHVTWSLLMLLALPAIFG